jgi:hypothetical protein
MLQDWCPILLIVRAWQPWRTESEDLLLQQANVAVGFDGSVIATSKCMLVFVKSVIMSIPHVTNTHQSFKFKKIVINFVN